ncbi:MAG TPA: ABC transporter substrate-binding protein, partial [Pyrinomonadaceae bacterium]|nr:ABC transporter substrate-binding protein [Pyrinomonadaceae bacterium]
IKTLGELLGQQAEAEKLVDDLRTRAAAVEDAVKARPVVSVFYQVSPSPLWTAGRKSWITDLIKRAGGRSVTSEVEGEWMRYSDEAAMASKPEAIIMATGGEEKMEVAPALQKSPAALNKRVYGISADYLSRPGPRLVDGLEEMARALHPEAFKTVSDNLKRDEKSVVHEATRHEKARICFVSFRVASWIVQRSRSNLIAL